MPKLSTWSKIVHFSTSQDVPMQESDDETDLPANPETSSMVGFKEDSLLAALPEKKEEVRLDCIWISVV